MNSVQWLWQTGGLVAIYLAILAICLVLVPNFASTTNFKGLLLSVTTIGMVSCTMMLCLAAADFDLSVGSLVAVAGVVGAQVVNHTGSVTLAVLAAVGVGLGFGIINGINIAVGGINALIATLATMQVARGLAYLLCTPAGVPVGVRTPAFYALGQSRLFGWDAPVLMMVAMFVVFGFVLNFTIFGRNALAIGGNIEATRLAGVRVKLCKVVIFALQGAVCGFAGCVLAARLTSAQPSTSMGLELQCISACVLGGVSLTGGIASISGVIVGVLIIGTLQNVLNLMNVNNFYQYLVSGTVLILAVYVDRVKNRARR
ncbi:MAG: L-arabinose ABC transporter permease AraH [Tepidisphaeraceae bacterium]